MTTISGGTAESAAIRSRAPDDDEFILSKVPRVTIAFWIVKIFATTVGETGGDALSMQLNLGYAVSTLIFLGFFLVTLTAQVASKHYHPLYYWAVVVATTTGLGFQGGALVFASLLAVVAALYFFTKISRSVLFWAAYVLTRPLGATLGDTLTKPHNQGGLNLSRITSSIVIAIGMVLIVMMTSLRKRGIPNEGHGANHR
jgi:uncharacterized membrane-anchored protein